MRGIYMHPSRTDDRQSASETRLEGAAASGKRPPASARRKPRRWLPYAAVLVLLGLIVAGLWPKPAPVEIASVAVGPLRVTVNEEGKTRVRDRYVVYAPVAGQLRRPPFKAGGRVARGETVVAVIDALSPTMLDERTLKAAQARREAAAARVAKARAELEFGEAELQRFKALFDQQTVSAQEFDGAQLRKTAADRNLAAAEGELRQAEAELAEFESAGMANRKPREVLAPESGRVLRVFEESARAVSAGMPLLEIGNPGDLEAVVEVLSRDGAVIQPGMAVDFEQWGGGQLLEGRVRLVEPAGFTKVSALGVEEQRVNVVVDIVTPPAGRGNLGDNFRVEAKIIVWEEAEAVKVPAGALFRQGEDWAAYVVENGRARFRKVQVGRTSGAETQVLSGLKKNEKVIIYPGSRIREGLRVRPIEV